jgi:hypothetical protein
VPPSLTFAHDKVVLMRRRTYCLHTTVLRLKSSEKNHFSLSVALHVSVGERKKKIVGTFLTRKRMEK